MMFIDVLNVPKTPKAADMAAALRGRRLGFNMSQENLSKASGVPLATLKKFERTGQISLTSFLALCDTLEVDLDLDELIPPAPPASLDEVDGPAPRRTRKRASPRGGRA